MTLPECASFRPFHQDQFKFERVAEKQKAAWSEPGGFFCGFVTEALIPML
jgi:hypothetical protein